MMLKLALLFFAFSSATGQQLAPASSSVAPSATPSAEPSPPALDEEIVPTFETQKLARTYILDIPAPRGQITDRNGAPLAQNQLSYNLAINFPTPLEFNDARYARVRASADRGRVKVDRPSNPRAR
jgi:penicillin-binding protein 2